MDQFLHNHAQKPENKAKQKEYAQKPEQKAKKKAREKTPEYKAKRKEYMKKYVLTPEQKAKQKEYAQKPENKAKQKEYAQKPEQKAKRKTSEYKAKQKEYAQSLRREVLSTYSKRHSNSSIPCCRCCGENFDVDFLAVDHIAGKKEMDSETALVELGYSSKFVAGKLFGWIKYNGFPDGFQILCTNCNFAKGIKGNNNICPHKRDKKCIIRNNQRKSVLVQTKDEQKAKQKEYAQSLRREVLSTYSKRHSNSSIPCCRCCGEDFDVDFLAVDHIAGKKEMDSETALVESGYSSKLHRGQTLLSWIKDNGFPDGFQTLCHMCNFAKGMQGNDNKCPHQK